jgi:RNA polymerase sigma-70 factor (ECF subfamily)
MEMRVVPTLAASSAAAGTRNLEMNNLEARRCLTELEQYRPVIRRLLPTIYDVDDVFQEVYVAAHHQNHGPHGKTAWLRTVARNIAVRRHREENVRHCPSLSTDPRSNEAQEPFAKLARVESQNIIREAVRSLKPNYRYVVEQRFFAEKSFLEIARALEIPEETVRTRCKRAFKHLKENAHLAAIA